MERMVVTPPKEQHRERPRLQIQGYDRSSLKKMLPTRAKMARGFSFKNIRGFSATFSASFKIAKVTKRTIRHSLVRWQPIQAESVMYYRWSMLVLVAVLYSAWMVPFQLAWEQDTAADGGSAAANSTSGGISGGGGGGGGSVVPNVDRGSAALSESIDMVIEAVFLLDLALHFRVPYQDPVTNEPVEERHKIRRHYLRGWFAVDACSALPVEIIQAIYTALGGTTTGGGAGARALTGTRMLKLLRLAKLARLHWIRRVSREYPTQARVVQFVLTFFFTIHLMACCYWGVVRDVCPTAAPGGGDPFCISSDGASAAREADQAHGQDSVTGRSYEYASAFYWAIWVMLGNGNSTQMGTSTYWFTSVMLVVGITMFSAILGSASAFLSQLDAGKLARQREINFVRTYMHTRKIKPNLQRQISEYYEVEWGGGGGWAITTHCFPTPTNGSASSPDQTRPNTH